VKREFVFEFDDVVSAIHAEVDVAARCLIDVEGAPCHLGCSWCCYLRADCSIDEAYLIARFIRALPPVIRRRIDRFENRWFKIHGDDDETSEMIELFKAGMPMEEAKVLEREACIRHRVRAQEKRCPCPYLMADKCVIYPVRPISCRDTYPKKGFDPEDCRTGEAPLTSLEISPIMGVFAKFGMNFADQGRIPAQVRRARKELHL
jgi:hypothetical protein